MKVCIINLGCKVNQCECDSIAAGFAKLGYQVSESFEQADAYVINTCAVTKEAEKKSRQCVARVRKYNPQAAVYVVGCASQKNPEQFVNKQVTFVGGNADKMSVCHFPQGVASLPLPTQYETMPYAEGEHTRAVVKIQDGCNNFCSYCIVPYLRGRSRSRAIQDVVAECQSKQNVKEIVLTGINASAYGKDIDTSLVELVRALGALQGVRFRFGSLEANVIDEELLQAMADSHFCDHFHLSLQSGDDGVLRDMNRHYTSEQFAQKVALIRRYFPFAGVTTDIIVGYPTESKEAFDNTLAFAEEIAFADIHVFPYSRREGTVAYRLPPIDPAEMDRRVAEMTALKKKLHTRFLQGFVDKELQVLIESPDSLFWVGHSGNYIKIYMDDTSACQQGETYTVRCVEPFRDGMFAVLVGQ